MPGMNDPSFEETVTLICEHTSEGAMGVIINRPTPLTLGDVLGELDLAASSTAMAERQVVAGGPVSQDRGFVVHGQPGEFESTLEVSTDLRISFSLDVVNWLATLGQPEKILFGLGYAGWESGQLEQEILSNAWLTTPSDTGIVFDVPFEARWKAAADLIGVDLARIAPGAGHD